MTIKFTHYVVWDDVGIRMAHALCGELVLRKEHDNDPTCPACRAILAARDASAGPS
jgi:hypothetical protein